MSLSVEEQETVVSYVRDNDIATIYTSDTTTMTKLDKLYRIVRTDVVDGKIVAKTYECDKRLISFRSDPNFKPEYARKRKMNPDNLAKMLAARRGGDQ